MHSNKNKKSIVKGSAKILNNTSFIVKEAYSAIRASLLSASKKENCNVIVISGSSENSGKTLTCINLAISFARTGKKILLVDGNFRIPTDYSIIGADNKNSLSDYIMGHIDNISIASTDFENLFVVNAGSVLIDPAELFYSDKFNSLIEECREKYDYIFIDTPPINVVSDALMIADKDCLGYVLVVRAGKDTEEELKTTINSIHKVNGKILGVVLNDVNDKIHILGDFVRKNKKSKYFLKK